MCSHACVYPVLVASAGQVLHNDPGPPPFPLSLLPHASWSPQEAATVAGEWPERMSKGGTLFRRVGRSGLLQERLLVDTAGARSRLL